MNNFPTLELVLHELTQEVFNDYKKRLSDKGYALANQISFEVVRLGTKYQCVINLQDYWKYIEDGRRAGAKAPPPDVILNWLDKKNLFKASSKVKEPEQAAYLIGRHIAKNGIKPKKYMEQSMKITDKYKERIEQALLTDLNK